MHNEGGGTAANITDTQIWFDVEAAVAAYAIS